RRLAGSTDREFVKAFARLAIVLARVVEVATVALLFEAWQQRLDRRAHVTHHAHVDRRPPPDHLPAPVNLGDPHAAAPRLELPIRKIGAEHEQNVAIEHGVVARRKADQPGHADVVGIIPLDCSLPLRACTIGAFRHWASASSCAWAPWHPEPQSIVTRPPPLRRAANRSRSGSAGATIGRAGSRPDGLGTGASAAGCSATSPGMTPTATPRAAPAACIAISKERGIWFPLEISSH